ncbi:MAG: FliM/FliN family flagellar motor switch protein [Phycisphaerales bacterium]|nr:MAG: FliM/FliN family flagellar motor switch protein [Phycisphaerales bacterium]
MSDSPDNNVGKDKMKQILAAARTNTPDETADVDAVEYNWRQSHYFTREQLKKLEDFIKRVALLAAEKFTALCQNDFTIETGSITQHFVSELVQEASESQQGHYYLAFGSENEIACGLFTIPVKTAVDWVAQLLSDPESREESNVKFTKLEESLLLDAASAFVEALSESHDEHSFHPADTVVRGWLPLELQGTQELCRIVLNVKRANSQTTTEIQLSVLCEKLEPIIGKRARAEERLSAEETSKAVLAHLQETQVCLEARLGSVTLAFEEIADLQPYDVLLLDRRVDEPIDLLVEGLELLGGWPAKSTGRYAVAVATTPSQRAG